MPNSNNRILWRKIVALLTLAAVAGEEYSLLSRLDACTGQTSVLNALCCVRAGTPFPEFGLFIVCFGVLVAVLFARREPRAWGAGAFVGTVVGGFLHGAAQDVLRWLCHHR